MQDSPVDVANYYLNDNNGFGMFSYHGVPRKNYFGVKAFSTLLDTPVRLNVDGARPLGFAVLAGRDSENKEIRVLVANHGVENPEIKLDLKNLPWQGPTRFEITSVDKANDFEVARNGMIDGADINLSPNCGSMTVVLLRLWPARQMGIKKK